MKDNSIPTQQDYLHQSDQVKARFDKLKSREVILEVKNLDKVFKSAKGETTALKTKIPTASGARNSVANAGSRPRISMAPATVSVILIM